MTQISVFDYSDYKAYLSSYFEASGGRSGLRLKAAHAIDCQTSYFSRVLNGEAHFSLEQGQKLNQFLAHGQDESHYFLLLLQLARSGTKELKKYFEKQIESLLEARNRIEKRVASPTKLSDQDESLYYSTWKYAALHMASLNPKKRSFEALASLLEISLEEVKEKARDLEKMNVVQIKAGEAWPSSATNVHLERESVHISKHHANWRLRGIQEIEKRKSQGVHYSVVYSGSQAALKNVKKRILKLIEENANEVKASDDEALAAFNLDFYQFGEAD